MIEVKALKSLLKKQPATEVHILSTEGDVYQVRIVQDDKEQLLTTDETGKPLKFKSLDEAKHKLKYLGVHNCFLQHHVAYAEMIGESGDGLQGDLMPIRLQESYS
ncbi:DUF6482 family protein [Pelagibaculum spongiae]|uniref:Na(+)-translocating NADH-quinone reductase subunit B n=1 Tax=Pelagibaculum spongiae TaxID=2080658 RepID=A0A2V1GYN1_9GAMM|nr:DUF6482 family protein [Pelagibaculum spongiae]PVZ67632.1 hypothetical protein DC094_14430 [Pelagibaculum spongiae]